ncbi:MAG: Rrf2 family transcriptional regulator [Tepidisphaeraceae bacterium]
MKLSKRTEYAIRAMVHLAQLDPGQYVQSRDLAKQERLPNKFLESVLLGLKKAGYLESKVGSGGGYRLIQPSSQISMGTLLRTLEGREKGTDGALPRDAMQGEVALKLIEDQIAAAYARILDKMTLEQLVEDVNAKTSQKDEMFYI